MYVLLEWNVACGAYPSGNVISGLEKSKIAVHDGGERRVTCIARPTMPSFVVRRMWGDGRMLPT